MHGWLLPKILGNGGMLNGEVRKMDNEKIDPKGLEFNNQFKKASFDERLSMDNYKWRK